MFVDNEAAKSALIKGTSTTNVAARLVHQFWGTVAEVEAHVWVDRVPSRSNPADGPSREKLGTMQVLGCVRVQCVWPGLDSEDGGMASPWQ